MEVFSVVKSNCYCHGSICSRGCSRNYSCCNDC